MPSANAMTYDPLLQSALDGQIRAAAFNLGHMVVPVQQWVDQQEAAFDVLTASPEMEQHLHDLRGLLEAMAAYCAAADASTTQLRANLGAAEETMHREATRASFMARQFQLTHVNYVQMRGKAEQYLLLLQQEYKARGGQPA